MGQQKKEANRKERQGKTGDGMANVKVKGENFYRYVTVATAVSAGIANTSAAMRRRSRP
jgi:DNA-binding protein YbaB